MVLDDTFGSLVIYNRHLKNNKYIVGNRFFALILQFKLKAKPLLFLTISLKNEKTTILFERIISNLLVFASVVYCLFDFFIRWFGISGSHGYHFL